MSYCRFSSMNYMCDIYLYEAVGGGYSLHVAAKRPDIPAPKMPAFDEDIGGFNVDEISQWQQNYKDWSDVVNHVAINLPYDGQSFSLEDVGEVVDTLKMLRESGYNMPDDLEEMLLEEKYK